MSWYYAENNERRGPVEDLAFETMVASGRIKSDTLVWREGMENWLPLSAAGYRPEPTGPAADSPGESPRTGEPMGMCSESGRILPRSELVEIEGRLVSAEYKNIVLQRIREGVGGSGLEDPELIGQRIAERDWHLDAASCLSRGWMLVKSRFWLTVSATFVVYLLIGVVSMIPFASLIVQGPLIGGLYWLLLKLIRNEPAALEDIFQGFSRGFGQLIGATLISGLAAVLAIAPGGLLVVVAASRTSADSANPFSPLLIVGILLLFAGALVAIHFTISWVFALVLIVDKRIECWPAMKLSRRVVNMHWWQVFWLMLLTGIVITAVLLLAIALVVALVAVLSAVADFGIAIGVGILLGLGLGLGIFAVLPVGFSALVIAYEDLFGEKTNH
ncbi:MAG TPA: DUF4339 domain-containing protein [Chthoniobacteraceae bacterium]|jgi:hypothetical protein